MEYTQLGLVRYETACKAIADALSVDEAKAIRDTAEALRAYAFQAKNRQLEIDAAEIRLRAERRVGEMIREQKDAVGLNRGMAGTRVTGSDIVPVRDTRPTLADVGIDKKLSSRAQKLAAVPEEKFESMLGEWRKLQQETDRVTVNLLREGERTKGDVFTPSTPVGKYPTIVIDPPWSYANKSGRHAPDYNKENRSMTLDEVAAFDIQRWVADPCHLYLWVTDAYVGHVYNITEAWGFDPKATIVWVKDRFGMGNYFRHQHELCVFAARGTMRLRRMNASTVFNAPVTKHSEKPDEFYRLVESCSAGPYLDLFARKKRDGWDVYGDQVAPEVNCGRSIEE